MRWRGLISTIFIGAATLCAPAAFGQYAIHSIAGGGPNNLPAVQASIGFAQSVAFDSAGNLYIADLFSSQIYEVSTTGTLTVVAGNGTLGYSGDGGPATNAALNSPEGVFVDSSGNIFIADTSNSVIREVVASTHVIQTVAGNGTAGYSGDGGPATSAQLNDPYAVFVGLAGNIFIADTDNSVIREVLAASGNIQTIAGTGTAGYSGDSGLATSAQLDMPEGVFVDASGSVYIADTSNSVVREITAGTINTVAGVYYDASQSGCNSAELCMPNSVFVDSSNNLFIADTQNQVIRKVVSGTLQTVAGDGTAGYSGNGGPATSAELNYPGGMVLDSSGDIFIADTFNYVVREVISGTIQAFAGNNTLAYSGDGGPASTASLNIPGGTFADSAGNIYIADTNNSAIRVFNTGSSPVTIAGVTIQPGDIGTVAGDGAACALLPCGDGGAATSAELDLPYNVFVDPSGNIYIADTSFATGGSAIRVVNTQATAITIAGTIIQPNTIETVAGTLGTAGFSGDGGAPTSAKLSNPQGVFLDAAGNIYIADTENSAIRVVNTGSTALTIAGTTIQPNTIQTVAGTPPNTCSDPSTGCGDNGPASAAALNFPAGISVDTGGNIYIADSQNSVIRVVNSGTASIAIAGTTIPAGDILTVAGTMGQYGYSGDNGPPASALLNTPWGVYVDSLGNIFIADTDNSAIRQVVGIAATIQTIAGTGTAGFSGDGGPGTSAALNGPESATLGPSGSILIADSQNLRIRQLTSTVGVTVEPASTVVAPGGTQEFLAEVTGTINAAVTWQVNSITGGNSTVGTISSLGLYQAPATAPASPITVTAISNANGTTSGSAQVTIAAAGAPAISVSTSPAGVTVVYTTNTQAFTATVTGETNTAVNWEANGIVGGNSTVGTVDTSGNYTAPGTVPSPALVMITAVSQADSTVSGSYPLTIVTTPAAASPAAQTVSPGGTATFSLALKANTGNPQDPMNLSCLQSSMPSGASCTFTPATIIPSNKPVSFSLAVSVPSSAALLSPLRPHPSWLVAQVYFGFAPLAGLLLIGVKRRTLRRRCLGLAAMCMFFFGLIACGGGSSSTPLPNPVTYNIQVQGTTRAQPTPVTITTVKLTVQ